MIYKVSAPINGKQEDNLTTQEDNRQAWSQAKDQQAA